MKSTSARFLTNCRDGGNNFAQLKFIQNSCFSGRIQTDHKDPHFLFAEKIFEHAHEKTHGVGLAIVECVKVSFLEKMF